VRGFLPAAALALVAGGVAAEPVQIRDGSLRLNGKLERPAAATSPDSIAIVLHGTLSHHGQETVVSFQHNLAARGIVTLAVTLSLGIDDRRGPRACTPAHTHTLADAARELGLWEDWALGHGFATIDHVGFSRGGAQLAELMRAPRRGRRLVLLAPALAVDADIATAYRKAYGGELAHALDAARAAPREARTVDFLYCRQAEVSGAAFLDAYREVPPVLLSSIDRPLLVVVAGSDEIVPNLEPRLPAGIRRVRVDGADHFFSDLNGEDAADAIAAFLTEP
jgi:hypothetical protein